LIEHRPRSELGGGDHGWLRALHHFAIGGYGNPIHRPIGNLYVWNDDEIAPGAGFPFHPHVNVEIVTYVREGAVSHRDSLGNSGRTEAGDVQVMSAGSGIRHTEMNEQSITTKLFQIWLAPRERGGAPRWGTKPFPKSSRAGRFVSLASGFGDEDALPIRADARVAGATLQVGARLSYALPLDHHAYLVPADGLVNVNGVQVKARDGIALSGEPRVEILALEQSELVLVETR
jgi:redox-sensitive bicupin YhaK (pirin superfamily)